jgi:hypothetical protein
MNRYRNARARFYYWRRGEVAPCRRCVIVRGDNLTRWQWIACPCEWGNQ